MNNKDFYDLFAKTDLTDVTPPDFSLPQHKRKSFVRKSMKKIMAYEKSNFRYTEEPIKIRKRSISIFASIILISLVLIMLSNVTLVVAFFKNLFYIPGIGITGNENLVSAVLDEPILIQTGGWDFMLEFATKVKRDDGRCEILLYFSSEYYMRESYITPMSAVIDGKEYEFTLNNMAYSGNAYFSISNYDFPDVNEFDLILNNTTTHIVMSELNGEEKIPHLSDSINGISLAAYKYRNNNTLFGIDIINNNLTENEKSTSLLYYDVSVYDSDENILNTNGYSSSGYSNESEEYGLGYNVVTFKNKENKSIAKLSVGAIGVIYRYDTESDPLKITIPIPKDGETIHTDIKLHIGGVIYELTEVRREGDTIYFKDNCQRDELPITQSDVENHEISIVAFHMAGNGIKIKYDGSENKITKFNSNAKSIEMAVDYIMVKYYGDFTISFD